MRTHHPSIVVACLSFVLAIQAGSNAGDLKPYPLPPEARARIDDLAASSDVLILGEIHGTQEVPKLVAGLLTPLAERGYRVLALEVPNNEQAALRAWARGETRKVPNFFANPSGDGRGNAQLLELVRIAVSPPFRWQVVCFDESESILDVLREAMSPKKPPGGADVARPTEDDVMGFWRKRDASMASNLLRETKSLKPSEKILAICGNVHARTANDAKDPVLSKLWPSFAAMVTQKEPARRVRSVNIDYYRGSFFNEGKVRTIQPPRPLEHAVARPGDHSEWNLLLDLPEATPVTFVSRDNAVPR